MQSPGNALVPSSLTVARKLQLLFALTLLPLGLLLYLFIDQVRHDIIFSDQEIAGVGYLESTWPLFVHALDISDGIPNAEGGDIAQKLAAAAEKYPSLAAAHELTSQTLKEYAAVLAKPTDAEAAQQTVNTVQSLITKIADTSNLTLDSDLDSYYVMNSITGKLIDLQQAASALLRLNHGTSTTGFSAEQKAEFVISIQHFKDAQTAVEHDFASAMESNHDGSIKASLHTPLANLQSSSEALATAATELAAGKTDSADFVKAEEAFTTSNTSYWQAAATELSQLLHHRVNGLWEELTINLAIVVGLCALILCFIILIVRSISVNLSELNRAFAALAQLDLTLRSKVRTRDDIGQTLTSYNTTAEVLSEVISSTQQSAITVSAATNELSSTMANISGISSRQEAAMDEIVSAVHEASASAQNAATKTAASSEINMTAFSRIHAIKNMLERLHQNSHDIQEARDLIDSISDKINLLSLNATIEAARAGEAGRGFAVVADEVKKLALRTSDSTESIGKTVDSLKHNVADSSKELDAILGLLEEVRGNSEDVVSAVHSQEAAVQQISVKIDEFRQQLTQVSSNVHESRLASESIAESAEQLSQQSRRFKISNRT